MVEIKRITCDDKSGETLWEGVLVPLKNGNYEGYIHSSVTINQINFEYIGCDVKLTIRRKAFGENDKCSFDISNLALINSTGLTEWFTNDKKNTVVCTKENVNNVLAKAYTKQLENNKYYIGKE